MAQATGGYGTDRDKKGYWDLFDVVVGREPIFLSAVNRAPVQKVLQLVWWDDVMDATVLTVDNVAGYADTATAIVCDSVTGVAAGALLRPAGADEVMQVTAVDTGTKTLTVDRGFGSTTAVALSDGQELQLVSQGTKEGDSGHTTAMAQGAQRTNEFQKFHKQYGVTGTRAHVGAHGLNALDAVAAERADAMRKIVYEVNTQAIYGVDQAMSTSQEGYFRGMYHAIAQAGGTVTPVGGTLSETVLNGAVRRLRKRGAQPTAVITNPKNITTIASAVANRLQWVNSEINVAGYAVSSFLAQTGERLTFYLDHNVDESHAIVCDLRRVELVPRRDFEDNPVGQGSDAQQFNLISELSLRVKNAAETGEILTGLT